MIFLKRIVFLILLISAGAFLTWAFREGRKELEREREREMPVKIAPRIQTTPEGGVKIVLDRETQDLAGIQTQPIKKTSSGFLVPFSSVLHQDGQTWLYVQAAPGEFVRKSLRLGEPASNGYVVTIGLTAGQAVVTVGAQLLLSEELKAQIQILEEGR